MASSNRPRKLNKETVEEPYPIPTIQEIIDKIGKNNKYFSKL